MTPIVVTTGAGPHGIQTVWVQPPDDNSMIDPILLAEDRATIAASHTPAASQPRVRSFGNDATNTRELRMFNQLMTNSLTKYRDTHSSSWSQAFHGLSGG